MKRVIHIFGASGSGTSTLGKKLSEELGYRWMDTDDYFWIPTNPRFTVKRPVEQRLELINRDIQEADNAVISGALAGWGDPLIPQFTLAIRIVTDTEVRIARIRQREKERFGDRIEEGGDMYQHHLDFLEWAGAYDTGGPDMRSKAKHDQWQKQLYCPLLVLDGSADLHENVVKVKKFLAENGKSSCLT